MDGFPIPHDSRVRRCSRFAIHMDDFLIRIGLFRIHSDHFSIHTDFFRSYMNRFSIHITRRAIHMSRQCQKFKSEPNFPHSRCRNRPSVFFCVNNTQEKLRFFCGERQEPFEVSV